LADWAIFVEFCDEHRNDHIHKNIKQRRQRYKLGRWPEAVYAYADSELLRDMAEMVESTTR